MKLALIFFASLGLSATLNVCTTQVAFVCTYNNVQAAAIASNPGDTILLQAGQNLGGLTMPGGWHNVTIKSNAIDSYPRNQRIMRGGCIPPNTLTESATGVFSCSPSQSSSVLARLTSVQLGDNNLFMTPQSGTVSSDGAGNITWVSGIAFPVGIAQLYIAGIIYPVNVYTDNHHVSVNVGVFYLGNLGLTAPTLPPAGSFSYFSPSSPTPSLINNPGASPSSTGLGINQKVILNGQLFSAYYCGPLGGGYPPAPYNSGGDNSCISPSNVARAGFINIRISTGLYNGAIITFTGRSVPSPLQLNTPYYVINFTAGSNYGGGSSVAQADKFQISATLNGSAISIPFFNPTGQDFIVEFDPLPATNGTAMYVLTTPSMNGVTLSLTMGGSPVTFTQCPWGYNGSIPTAGFGMFTENPVHDITFDGIELYPGVAGTYFPFHIQANIGFHDFAGEHYNISLLRSWLHNGDNQLDSPLAMINIAAKNLEIGWNIIEDQYYTGGDSQGISYQATCCAYVHDNEIRGGAEGILTGGNIPWFGFGSNATQGTVWRNYIWKPLKYFNGVYPYVISATQFALGSRYTQGGTDCASASTNAQLAQQCFGYESQETPTTSTPPASPTITRDVWSQNVANSTFTVGLGTNNTYGMLYWLGGAIHMDYNFTTSVSCPSGVTCTFVATPYFPATSSRIGIACLGTISAVNCGSGGSSGFDGNFYIEMRNVWAKDAFESKYGDNWNIQGNVFSRLGNIDGGTTTQAALMNLTSGVTGSGLGQPVNYSATTSNSLVANNLFRMAPGGMTGAGTSFAVNVGAAGLTYEWAGFGGSNLNTIQNNAFMDMGSTYYTAFQNGFVFNQGNSTNYIINHNSSWDTSGFITVNGTIGSQFTSNLAVSYRTSCINGGCTYPASSDAAGVDSALYNVPYPFVTGSSANSWAQAMAAGDIDNTSNLLNNVMSNRPGFVFNSTVGPGSSYPSNTYLMAPLSAPGTAAQPSTLFTSWQEIVNAGYVPSGVIYRQGNYHLANGIVALYPAVDSRAIGADIDEIAAMVGGIQASSISSQNNMTGSDVETGQAQFYQRVARIENIGSTTFNLSYLSDGFGCTIQLWTNSAYSGSPAISINDTGATIVQGLIIVPVSGLTAGTAYWGKRLCGPEADIISFTTLLAPIVQTVSLAPPAGTVNCETQYGATIALGSVSSPVAVSGGLCTLTIPSTTFYRAAYLNGGGSTIAVGSIQHY